MHIRIRRPWEIHGSEAVPEQVYLDRRRFLTIVGLGTLGLGAGAILQGCGAGGPVGESANSAGPKTVPLPPPKSPYYPAKRNGTYALDRPLTDEVVAARYNNFYEFTEDKARVAELARALPVDPWSVEVAGLVSKPRTFGLEDLLKEMPLEERLYRHRCVEAWAMAVPWTGFPLSALIARVEPKPQATHVQLISFLNRDVAPGQRGPWYPWPYYEGLTMGEAMNELTMLVTGIYGHELPKQHGAPIRLVTPWKYGFKSIKSVVRINFLDRRPPNFWNDVAPSEYDFFANVNPAVPHPRWSQARERMIDTGEYRPTLPFNGYGEYVASLYRSA